MQKILDQMRDCRVKQVVRGGTTYLSKADTIKWVSRIDAAKHGEKKGIYSRMMGEVASLNSESACFSCLKKFAKKYEIENKLGRS